MRNIGRNTSQDAKNGVKHTEKNTSHNSKHTVKIQLIGKRDERIMKHTERRSTPVSVSVAVPLKPTDRI